MDFPGEKLVIKMWETLTEKGVGSLLSPWHSSRVGRARIDVRREEIIVIAQAERDAADIRSGKKQLRADGTLLLTNSEQIIISNPNERIEPTFNLANAIQSGIRSSVDAAARSEINASKAILIAEQQLADDPQIPPAGSIDDDWLFIWREYAGKFSNEDLQKLWGSVLAGEVKAPGKYSIRTLELLKTLSKSEADLITKLASYVIDGRVIRSQSDYLNAKGLNFTFLLVLQELGLISGIESGGIATTFRSNKSEKFFRALVSHNKALIVEHDDVNKSLEVEVYLLTEVGLQILGLGSFEPDIEYMRLVGKSFLNDGFTVKLADWEQVSENKARYFNDEELVSSVG